MKRLSYKEQWSLLEKMNLTQIITPDLFLEAEIRQYQEKELLILSGEPLTDLFLLIEGQVIIHSSSEEGKKILLDHESAGSILGDIEYFQQLDYLHTVEAMTPAKAIVFSAAQVESLFSNNTFFWKMFSKSLSDKLMETSNNYAHRLMYPLKIRLCQLLIKEAPLTEQRVFPFSTRQAAQILGVSERHLRRIFNELKTEKVLIKEIHTIRILDFQKLKEMANW